jgi:hypothetical protein
MKAVPGLGHSTNMMKGVVMMNWNQNHFAAFKFGSGIFACSGD